MALTPEDVVNKRFQTTKFREGYDQDEVDDFLDEVVEELRRLTRENEDLRQRLAAAESGTAAAVSAPVPAAETAPTPAPAAVAVEETSLDSENATNLLQLARRLHEEHVREGIEKRDALISEAQATAARILSEAETQQRLSIQQAEQQKAILDQEIDELRIFERDYRSKLKGFIESQLNQLETVSSFAPAGLQATGHEQPAEPFPAE